MTSPIGFLVDSLGQPTKNVVLTPAQIAAGATSVVAATPNGPVDASGATPAGMSTLAMQAQIAALVSADGNRTYYVDASYANNAAASDAFTTYFQSLAATASSAYSAALGRVRLKFAPGTYTLGDRHRWQPNVWYDFGDAVFQQSLTLGNPGAPMFMCARTSVAGTYYGRHNNIKITGGTAVSNGYSGGGHIVEMTEFVDSEINGFGVQHTSGRNNWAWYLTGRRIRLTDPRVIGGLAVFQDGLHFGQGSGLTVINGIIDAGDDAFVIGQDINSADPLYATDDEGISNIVVYGTQVNATRGYGVSVYYGQDLVAAGGTYRRTIREVTMTNITGSAGQLANGGIRVSDTSNASSPGTNNSVMSGITIQAKLTVGSAAHDGTNAQGVIVRGGTDIDIDASMTMVDNTMTIDSTHTRFTPLLVQCGAGLKIRLRQKGLVERGCIISPFSAAHTLTEWKLSECDIYGPTLDSLNAIDINNQVQGVMGQGNIVGGFIRGIRNGGYGILAQAGAATAGQLNIEDVVFKKAAGAAITYGYQGATLAAIGHIRMVGNDFTDLTSGSPGNQFQANHTSFFVEQNRNFTSRQAGAATIPSGATFIVVPLIATGVRFLDTSSAQLSQITVNPINIPTAGTSFRVQIESTVSIRITNYVGAVATDPGAGGATFSWSINVSKKPL